MDPDNATMTETTPAIPVLQPSTRKYIALRDILHEGQTIKQGAALPADFPLDSLKLMLLDKNVGEELPPAPPTAAALPEASAPPTA